MDCAGTCHRNKTILQDSCIFRHVHSHTEHFCDIVEGIRRLFPKVQVNSFIEVSGSVR